MANQNQILWPSRYEPASSPVHVYNELTMASPPERVWAWLVRVQLWPIWYPNSSNIHFLKGSPPDLSLGTVFRWKTFSVTVHSTVLEFVPLERIAWDAHGTGLDSYHPWLIKKQSRDATLLRKKLSMAGLPDGQKLLNQTD